MIVRSIWSDVPIPEHRTSDEIVTVPNDSSTIQELFERAARGESLGGGYDEFDDDSIFDDVHDPDLQDPLLREANRLNVLEDVRNRATSMVGGTSKKKKTVRRPSENTASSEEGSDVDSISLDTESSKG